MLVVLLYTCVCTCVLVLNVYMISASVYVHRRMYLSVAAAAIYMASQASDTKKTQKGMYEYK